jgi:hypothetical protein
MEAKLDEEGEDALGDDFEKELLGAARGVLE